MKNITDAADASDTVLLQGGLSQRLENSAMVLKSCYQLTAGSEILTQLCKTSKFHQKFESQNLGSQLCKRYQRSNFSQIWLLKLQWLQLQGFNWESHQAGKGNWYGIVESKVGPERDPLVRQWMRDKTLVG